MNCAEFEVLLHALIDGELDAGHARDVEAHTATCSGCAERLASFRAMREAMNGAALKETAPAHLRTRIETALAVPRSRVISKIRARRSPSGSGAPMLEVPDRAVVMVGIGES